MNRCDIVETILNQIAFYTYWIHFRYSEGYPSEKCRLSEVNSFLYKSQKICTRSFQVKLRWTSQLKYLMNFWPQILMEIINSTLVSVVWKFLILNINSILVITNASPKHEVYLINIFRTDFFVENVLKKKRSKFFVMRLGLSDKHHLWIDHNIEYIS